MRSPTRTPSGPDRLGDGFEEGGPGGVCAEFCKPGLEGDDDVMGGRPLVGLAEILSYHAASPIPPNGTAHFHRCRHAQATAAPGGDHGHCHERAPGACPRFEYEGEVVALSDPPFATETGPRRRHRSSRVKASTVGASPDGPSLYAPRRCRPLARRLLITSLPPFDLMRTRKPWVLLLRRLLGWNVLFTVLSSPCEK
jgi:hypothetical protein